MNARAAAEVETARLARAAPARQPVTATVVKPAASKSSTPKSPTPKPPSRPGAGKSAGGWRAALPQAPVVPLLLLVGSLLLTVWVYQASGFGSLLRGAPSTDAAGLRGRTLVLAGEDPLHPGTRTDLATLRGTPVLVCRMDVRTGRWLVGAIQRALPRLSRPVVLVAVSTAGDRDPADWVKAMGLPFRGALVDAATIKAWGFQEYQPEIRLIGPDGTVASGNLAGDGRDDTADALVKAISALP